MESPGSAKYRQNHKYLLGDIVTRRLSVYSPCRCSIGDLRKYVLVDVEVPINFAQEAKFLRRDLADCAETATTSFDRESEKSRFLMSGASSGSNAVYSQTNI
ncbi:hypothetical protein I7I53_11311 [Histoplasma capsulatum var. duboisii H88]|uniref:Uncharacterized protein n=1 Tax=Ajellomyces capsulatus (strain H88) TaxID=544711 RepID=A0A8A1LAA8_AJEC8|nr:hypothetical protein I7I53_11311 [Histoplasma capsulatum var. duboisii H88]